MSKTPKTLPIALCMAAATLASTAASARDDAAACPSVTAIQRRLVEHADQGMDSLRSYVWRTNATFNIGMTDVKASLDTWREAVACQERVARAASKEDVVSKADQASH